MGYLQVTAEPKMEDLLASIRKAIQDDIGEAPPSISVESRGTVFKGAMRESRVKFGDETERLPPETADIEDIRSRIHRNRTIDAFTRAAPAEPPPRAAGFAGILGGTAVRPVEPPPDLRPSYGEEDAAAHEAQHHADPKAPADYRADPGMMSAEAAAATNAAFDRLANALVGRTMGDRSVEDVAREMLRGMLKQWLDENLPALVERLVREEIERVARRGR